MLMMTEVIKIGVSMWFLERTDGRTSLNEVRVDHSLLSGAVPSIVTVLPLLQEMTHVMTHSVPMMVPSVVYLIMNWFSLFAFTYVDASTFAMVRTCPQLTILHLGITSWYTALDSPLYVDALQESVSAKHPKAWTFAGTLLMHSEHFRYRSPKGVKQLEGEVSGQTGSKKGPATV